MLHLIKLCVGCDSLQDLADWQKQRLKEKKAKGQKPELIHVTRQTLLELRPMRVKGVPHCGLVYHKDLIAVRPRPRSAFQGWRYFEPKDAPPDLAAAKGDKNLPEALRRELAALGLL
jgi:hypothetical protein